MADRLVIFDVDGTITGPQGVPDSAVETIKRIRTNGDVAVMFTGRPYAHTDKAVLNIGFDAYICTMGAFIKIGDNIINDVVPSRDITAKIVGLTREYKLDAAFEYSQGIAFDNTKPLGNTPAFLKKLFMSKGLETEADIDSPDFAFEKLCVWMNEGSDYDGFVSGIADDMMLIGKKQNMAEFVAPGISVEKSIAQVIEYFGIDYNKTYAIGDSINDLPFLNCAATKICMGEATDELKSQVDFVTKGLYEDGLKTAMEHYNLI